MTGMGSLLATTLLAVPLTAWLSRTILIEGPQLRLARSSNAPRGLFPISWNSNFSRNPDPLGVDEVRS